MVEWHRRVGQVFRTVILGAIAFTLTNATPAIANSSGTNDTDKLQQRWRLVSYDQQPISGDTDFTIRFGTDGEIDGFNGCNLAMFLLKMGLSDQNNQSPTVT